MKDNKALEALYRDFIENSGFSCVECNHSREMTFDEPYCMLAPDLKEMQRNTTTIGSECPYKQLFKQALTKEVSKDTNVEEVEEAYKIIYEWAYDHPYTKVKKLDEAFETIRKALSVPTKSAKEMFEELGYRCIVEEKSIKYSEGRHSIIFDKETKSHIHRQNNRYGEEIFMGSIKIELHQAITQQLKELEE